MSKRCHYAAWWLTSKAIIKLTFFSFHLCLQCGKKRYVKPKKYNNSLLSFKICSSVCQIIYKLTYFISYNNKNKYFHTRINFEKVCENKLCEIWVNIWRFFICISSKSLLNNQPLFDESLNPPTNHHLLISKNAER